MYSYKAILIPLLRRIQKEVKSRCSDADNVLECVLKVLEEFKIRIEDSSADEIDRYLF